MKCPRRECDGQLRVTHTYSAGRAGKTQRLLCDKCERPTTAVTILRDGEGYGNGASAAARRLTESDEERSLRSDRQSHEQALLGGGTALNGSGSPRSQRSGS